MKILLDLDGVMIKGSSWKIPNTLFDGFYEFDKEPIENLKKIISKTNATIVLTSTHRKRYTIEQWREIFKNRNIETTIELLDLYLDKNDAIVNWCNENLTEDYVIIDDDTRLYDLSNNIKQHLIITSPLIGFSNEDYNNFFNKYENNKRFYKC